MIVLAAVLRHANFMSQTIRGCIIHVDENCVQGHDMLVISTWATTVLATAMKVTTIEATELQGSSTCAMSGP